MTCAIKRPFNSFGAQGRSVRCGADFERDALECGSLRVDGECVVDLWIRKAAKNEETVSMRAPADLILFS